MPRSCTFCTHPQQSTLTWQCLNASSLGVTHITTHTYTHTYTHTHIHAHIHTHTHTYTHTHIQHTYTHIRTHTYAHTHTHTYAHTHTQVSTHVRVNTQRRRFYDHHELVLLDAQGVPRTCCANISENIIHTFHRVLLAQAISAFSDDGVVGLGRAHSQTV